MDAGKQIAVDNVRGTAVHHRLLVGLLGIGLHRGDKGGTDIAEVRPHRLGREDGIAGGDGAGQQQRAVKPGANFLHQGKGRDGPGMAAGTGGYRDQAIGAFLDRLAGKAVVDDVVQHDAAVGVHRLVDELLGPQRSDHDRHLVLHAQFQVVLQAVIGAVHDLVDRKRRRGSVGIGRVPSRQLRGDLLQPFFQLLRRPGIQRREGADDTGLALGDDQVRIGDDEHGGGNGW